MSRTRLALATAFLLVLAAPSGARAKKPSAQAGSDPPQQGAGISVSNR